MRCTDKEILSLSDRFFIPIKLISLVDLGSENGLLGTSFPGLFDVGQRGLSCGEHEGKTLVAHSDCGPVLLCTGLVVYMCSLGTWCCICQ